MPKLISDGVYYTNSSNSAREVIYRNTDSGLHSSTVQGALDELASNSAALATGVFYDNTQSGLAAENAQAAIDELKSSITIIRYGTSDPDDSVGNNGDIYIKYEA